MWWIISDIRGRVKGGESKPNIKSQKHNIYSDTELDFDTLAELISKAYREKIRANLLAAVSIKKMMRRLYAARKL